MEGAGENTVMKQGSMDGSEITEVGYYPVFNGQETQIMYHPMLNKYLFIRSGGEYLWMYDPVTRKSRTLNTNGQQVRAFTIGPMGSIVYSTSRRQVGTDNISALADENVQLLKIILYLFTLSRFNLDIIDTLFL